MTTKYVRRLKKWRTRLRKMGLCHTPIYAGRRWSHVLEVALAYNALQREAGLLGRVFDNNRAVLGSWFRYPSSRPIHYVAIDGTLSPETEEP